MSSGGGGEYVLYREAQVSSHPFCAHLLPTICLLGTLQVCCQCTLDVWWWWGGGVIMYYIGKIRSALIHFVFYLQYARHAAVLLSVHFGCLMGAGGCNVSGGSGQLSPILCPSLTHCMLGVLQFLSVIASCSSKQAFCSLCDRSCY